MTIVAGGKLQGGHVSVISVPWEGTRCSVMGRVTACLAGFEGVFYIGHPVSCVLWNIHVLCQFCNKCCLQVS